MLEKKHHKEVYKRIKRLLMAVGYNASGPMLDTMLEDTLESVAEYVEEQREEAVAETERNNNG